MFSNLLISIGVCVGSTNHASNPTLSATLSALDSLTCSGRHFLLTIYCRIPGTPGTDDDQTRAICPCIYSGNRSVLIGNRGARGGSSLHRLFDRVTIGFGCHLNGAGINRFDDGAYALLGLSRAVFVVVALFASLVVPLQPQWTRVAVRVAVSWIAASGLPMLGWTLHAAR